VTVLDLLLVIGAVTVAFGLGFGAGHACGWDSCWQDLTKDDAWRKEDPDAR
jgi:hypothetical protein